MEPNRVISIVPQPNREQLNEKEEVDYYEYRKSFLSWLLQFGKNPQKAKGYSPYTVYATGYRAAQFDRWVWQHRGTYHAPPSPGDATEYMSELALGDGSEVHKGKHLEMLKRYSKWLTENRGQKPWEFEWTFSGSGGNNAPRDFLSSDERQLIRQAVLKHDGNPAYGVKNKDALLSTETSWKYTSLVWTSLDAGLRPVEVKKASVSWVDTDNGVLRIPIEDSAKNEGNWTVSLTDRTAAALEYWLDERSHHPRYENTEHLWLTRWANPYGSDQLRKLLLRLCETAGIDTTNREMSWYAIRHSVGTYMTKERDLAATKSQLRHTNPMTTMKYDQVPVEDRRDALNNM